MKPKPFVLTALLTLAAPMLMGATTVPEAPDGVQPVSKTVSVPLTMDCAHISQSGREYARAHRIDVCGLLDGPDGADSRPQPRRTVTGDCGSASVTITPRGDGVAYIEWRLVSTTGPIVTYNVDLTYSGRSGVVDRPYSGWFPGNEVDDVAIPRLGIGPASAMLSGAVETFISTCYVGLPSADAYLN